ncbi:MAG: cupin domain-containing protein [Euzebya sp.]
MTLPAGDTGTATERVTIGPSDGCLRLSQQVVEFDPGTWAPRQVGQAEEVMFVEAGQGTLHLGTTSYPLAPDTSVHLVPGESCQISNPGPETLRVVSVRVPLDNDSATVGPRSVTRRLADQPLHTTDDRHFRITASPESGCRSVTQFVGEIPPGAAPPHRHTYDEIVYVLSGTGVCHIDGKATPVTPGSAVYLPPHTPHCMENTGNDTLRVLGVFHPAGDPSSKTKQGSEVPKTSEGSSS